MAAPSRDWLPGVHPSLNIQGDLGGPDPDEIEGFWRDQGLVVTRIPSTWRFERREDLERVVRIEFPPDFADELLAEHEGLEVDYHYALFSRTFSGNRVGLLSDPPRRPIVSAGAEKGAAQIHRPAS